MKYGHVIHMLISQRELRTDMQQRVLYQEIWNLVCQEVKCEAHSLNQQYNALNLTLTLN